MWDGYTAALVDYGVAMCDEWIRRCYEDHLRPRILQYDWGGDLVMPPWLTDDLCRVYRSLLLRKYPEHYRPLWPGEDSRIPFDFPNVPTPVQYEQ